MSEIPTTNSQSDCGTMTIWERLLDSLDTSGGHIFIMLLLLLIGIAMNKSGMPKGDEIVIGAFSALLMALKSVNSNHHRYVEDTTTTVVNAPRPSETTTTTSTNTPPIE